MTDPRRPILVSGDHVSSVDDSRTFCWPDQRLKCDPCVTLSLSFSLSISTKEYIYIDNTHANEKDLFFS